MPDHVYVVRVDLVAVRVVEVVVRVDHVPDRLVG